MKFCILLLITLCSLAITQALECLAPVSHFATFQLKSEGASPIPQEASDSQAIWEALASGTTPTIDIPDMFEIFNQLLEKDSSLQFTLITQALEALITIHKNINLASLASFKESLVRSRMVATYLSDLSRNIPGSNLSEKTKLASLQQEWDQLVEKWAKNIDSKTTEYQAYKQSANKQIQELNTQIASAQLRSLPRAANRLRPRPGLEVAQTPKQLSVRELTQQKNRLLALFEELDPAIESYQTNYLYKPEQTEEATEENKFGIVWSIQMRLRSLFSQEKNDSPPPTITHQDSGIDVREKKSILKSSNTSSDRKTREEHIEWDQKVQLNVVTITYPVSDTEESESESVSIASNKKEIPMDARFKDYLSKSEEEASEDKDTLQPVAGRRATPRHSSEKPLLEEEDEWAFTWLPGSPTSKPTPPTAPAPNYEETPVTYQPLNQLAQNSWYNDQPSITVDYAFAKEFVPQFETHFSKLQSQPATASYYEHLSKLNPMQRSGLAQKALDFITKREYYEIQLRRKDGPLANLEFALDMKNINALSRLETEADLISLSPYSEDDAKGLLSVLAMWLEHLSVKDIKDDVKLAYLKKVNGLWAALAQLKHSDTPLSVANLPSTTSPESYQTLVEANQQVIRYA